MKSIKILVLVILSAAVIAGCSKATYKKTTGGMPYQLYKGKDTKKITVGNFIKVNLIQKIKDSVYFTTYDKLPIYIPVSATPNMYDISELWTSLSPGDSFVATQMMDTFIKRMPDNIPKEFKKGDKIMTYVKILDVFPNDSLRMLDEEKLKKVYLENEVSFLEKYLKEKNITVQKTPSGAYVQIISPGSDMKVGLGKYITVNYTGTAFFSLKKFDSNTDTSFHHTDPLGFTVGTTGPGSMIKGLDEAVQLLNKGSVAKIYIPSMLGYGPSPDPRTGIKPFEHLIFDITVLDIKDKEPIRAEMKPIAPQKVDATQPKK